MVLLFAVALVVRVGWVAGTPHFRPMHDARDFDGYARTIVQTGRYPVMHRGPRAGQPVAYRPPGYPYFLAGIYELSHFKDRIWVARLVQAVTGTAAVGLIALIGWLLWGPLAGLVAGAIAAVYPPLVYVAESMYSETLFVPLELAAVAAALMHRRSSHRWRWAAVAGVLCGLLALVHPEGMALLLPLALLLWAERPRLSLRSLAAPALAVVCALVVIAPWTIRNALVLHAFVPITTELGNTAAGTYNDEARLDPDRPAAWREPRYTPEYSSLYWEHGLTDATLDHKLRSRVFAYIRKHPTYPAKVAFWNSVRLFELAGFEESTYVGETIGLDEGDTTVGVLAFWAVGLLALLGAVTAAARRAPPALWAFPLVSYLSVVFLITETPRFRIAMDPFLILLAALALGWVWNAWPRQARAATA
jgi:4-amino-4-deoxy-L-arabinose transferase-like glycosyltransferase